MPHVLRDLAFLGDGRRGAVLGPSGDIGFLCVPDWHSPDVFATLLGGRGQYTVTPADPHHTWGGFYEPGTLIWTNRWVTRDGVVHCRDALAFPGDPHGPMLLRRIEAVEGDAVLDVSLDVRGGFGRYRGQAHRHRDGSWTGRCGALRWRWSARFGVRAGDDGVLRGRLRVPAGSRYDLVLQIADRDPDPQEADPLAAWERTEAAWLAERPELDGLPAARDAAHAVAVLRGMMHPGGGIVAAATTSVPERAEQGRNYDYRYAWLRDLCITGHAAAAAGVDGLLDGVVRFVAARLNEHGPATAPAYTVTGAPVPDERPVPGLPGYPGGVAITGNHVNDQFQLDMFGNALGLFAAAARAGRLDAGAEAAMRAAARTIAERWRHPDNGIWELAPARWTQSGLTAVAGLRAAAEAAPERIGAAAARDWTGLADRMAADLARHHTHPSGRWQRARDDPRVDAALLLPPLFGALDDADPRYRATLAAVAAELTEDDLVYRYRPDDRPLGEAEGAFLLCGFAHAQALHRAGDTVAAVRVFERNRAACGPPGLFAEEYDVRQRQLRGNLPQSFVHAMLLQAACVLR
ncbi:glycoside hydrolase family 15 protein [Dactylosporangium sp. CA-139066]|uniref:glycoside hydrolase family 15 protein n=1 Tax=Dactylosporangium sp. CA-139066 TaxID=3239930 RepID=UPI003D8CADA3